MKGQKDTHTNQNTSGLPDLILFDGDCALCSWIVQFVIARDSRKRYRFAPLNSTIGKRYASLVDSAEGGTFILVRNEQVFIKSRAALEVVRTLKGLWPALYLFRAVPPMFRDSIYNVVARNRRRWFGGGEACRVPSPKDADRFWKEEAER